MPKIHEIRELAYTPEQIFDLVADVAKYPEFLPWVIATRITQNDDTQMIADMVVGFKALREKFTSRVVKERPGRITVHYVDGPLKNLENVWVISAHEGGGCVVDFTVNFTFKSRIFESLAGQYMDKALRKMIGAFSARADALYGNSSSNAFNAA